MSRIVRADPYLTREDTGADEGRTPAIQHYEKQNGSDGATSNTVFTLSKPYVTGSNTLVIYINGQKAELLVSATDETEYEETSSLTVTFGASLLDTDVVEFMVYGTYFIQDTDIYVTKANQNNNNIIINGNFDIWQRGTTFTSPISGVYLADRFEYQKVGTMVHTITQDTDVPTQAESGHLSNYSLKVDCTTADASVAAGDFCTISNVIEGYDYAQLEGNSATLSFWVKATKTGTYCVGGFNNGSDRSYVTEYTVLAADTWEKKTVTINFNYSGGTWDYTNGRGFDIRFTLMTGSTYQTTADAWQSGLYLGTSSQVNACDSTANNFYLAQVKLEKGQIATPFISRPFTEEVALCERYFQKTYNLVVDPGTVIGTGLQYQRANGTTYIHTVPMTTRMRDSGTGVLYSPITGASDAVRNYTAAADITTGLQFGTGEHGRYIQISSVTDQHAIGFHYTIDAEL